MEKKLPGHIAGFGKLRDMERLEQDYYSEYTDSGMNELHIYTLISLHFVFTLKCLLFGHH